MALLDTILGASKSSQGRTSKINGSINDLMTTMLLQKKAAAAAAAQQAAAVSPIAIASRSTSPRAGSNNSEAQELLNRLNRMIKDAPGPIKLGKTSRSYEEQVRLYNAYKAGKGPQAAKPGTSKHGDGRANDLQYGNDAVRQWVLANAGKYGIRFPIYNPKLPRHLDESWHAELA